MEPWEVMISESQERMVAIVRPQRVEAVEAVLDRWELEHAVIGEVTDTGELQAFWHGETVGAIPARLLTDECPRYEVAREPRTPSQAAEIVGAPSNEDALLELLASPALRSREFVFRRYDQLVGSRTVRRPGLDAAVLRLRPSMRGLAVSLDGQGRIASLDPFTGGALAVLEAARNVACVGGEPLGFTDCLNFGNPEKPEIGWELSEAIEGIAAACEAPRVSGRLRERLALQRDERPRDPSDPGRGGRRPRRGRPAGAARMERGRRGVRGGGVAGFAPRFRVPGALRRGGRSPCVSRPRARGAARLVPLARCSTLHSRPRRLGGRACRLPCGGRALLGRRCAGRARGRPARALR